MGIRFFPHPTFLPPLRPSPQLITSTGIFFSRLALPGIYIILVHIPTTFSVTEPLTKPPLMGNPAIRSHAYHESRKDSPSALTISAKASADLGLSQYKCTKSTPPISLSKENTEQVGVCNPPIYQIKPVAPFYLLPFSFALSKYKAPSFGLFPFKNTLNKGYFRYFRIC